eukprot:5675750-Alexandrium_andersonii.AAC.1
MQKELADAHKLYEFRKMGGAVPIRGISRFVDKSRSAWMSEGERPLVDPAAVVGMLDADEVLDREAPRHQFAHAG